MLKREIFQMRKRVIRLLIILFGFLFIFSCTAQKMKYGTKTEIDKADSLQSLARLKHIKNLDYSDFKAGKFDNGKVAVNYRFLKPKKLNRIKNIHWFWYFTVLVQLVQTILLKWEFYPKCGSSGK
jgi:hypothetical protein